MSDQNNTNINDTTIKLFQVLPIFSKIDNRIPMFDLTKSKLWQKRQKSKENSKENFTKNST
uniref:Uncharacterized protein n=1 Tax=Megaviridae environmental sample TaxID=1737588 RepID=A0A5J6VLB1_9VIRU|nr:MAG: hypothetical protein [Megaviridae environmental sample]